MSAPKRRDEAEDWREVPQLRGLRRLVTALTAVLMFGVLAVAATLVIRIAMEPGPSPLSAVGAERVALPAGETVIASGAGPSALTLVTRDAEGRERLRLYRPDTGALIDTVNIARD